MMFVVTLNGKPFRGFTSKSEAVRFVTAFTEIEKLQAIKDAYIEEALAKSDLSEAKEVIQHIMEL